ncbi:MAG: carbamoyl-phosphate synthase large subunit [Alphaproteobacteria bacterium]|nr:carbamoyl-phosphate synthase large subunit [Alphaproteobacteria bacterium]
MPKRTDINSILIIGAGPIVIGQACEFDYSGTQACKTLKAEGYRIILVNSNPATIMTDPGLADVTYMEPITPEFVSEIIEKERPDALLSTMGGQTALNCALSLRERGILNKFNVEMIGVSANTINKAENRQEFRESMKNIGLQTPRSELAHSSSEAISALEKIGLPAIIRPSFTLSGKGGGIAYNREEFIEIVGKGLDASPTKEVLIEESVLGWKEYEMEVIRDQKDNCIIICSIENIDPMGIHTGDSITVAPAMTLTDKEYQTMRNASISVLREIGMETGGANVQFAVNPKNGLMLVIEMNPRVSRSSAFASKATGFPIAKISAKLAVGYTLDELDNDITGGVTPASFEPSIDYVVTKIPYFAFEKFPGADTILTTSMKSVGEVMAIGRTFQESLQKTLRSLETGLTGLNEVEIPGLGQGDDKNAIRAAIAQPTPDRLLKVAQTLRLGTDQKQIYQSCSIDPWFIQQIQEIIETEKNIRCHGLPDDAKFLRQIKSQGFSDARLAELLGLDIKVVREKRIALGIRPVYKRIDTCAAEFGSPTDYIYSSYEPPFMGENADEASPTGQRKVIILGSGPNRIGQGIEFDYCCCQAAFALKDISIESIMINCNPETVSTDYDTSDRLYFEPLVEEDVIEIIEREQKNGDFLGVIVQFGGQTPLKLASSLQKAGIPILGTSPESIHLAEDRNRFKMLLDDIGLRQPENNIANSLEHAELIVRQIGYPVVVRPSYVLGGRAMGIIRDDAELKTYFNSVLPALLSPEKRQYFSGNQNAQMDAFLKEHPLLFDRYLQEATEVDVDALCDGETVFICGVMEHIEEAGIHSGDSASSLPPHSLSDTIVTEIERQTCILAKAMKVIGLINVQYAVTDGVVYVLEVNPRASRTVPFVAKVTGHPIAKIATRLMVGEKLSFFNLKTPKYQHVAVKEAVFPFDRFPGVDPVLGPEMRSTGEVIGIDKDFAMAFAKSQLGSGNLLPTDGTVFVSVRDDDKPRVLEAIRILEKIGFNVLATGGTQRFLTKHGISCKKTNKVLEGRPHIVDVIKNGGVHLVINTIGGAQTLIDSRSLRQAALLHRVPYYTTLAGTMAVVRAIQACQNGKFGVLPLQSYLVQRV